MRLDDYCKAIPILQQEDKKIRVTQWQFPPHSHTGWHRHSYDYVVIPMTDGQLRVTGKAPALDVLRKLITGESYTGPAGTEHDVINDGNYPIIFVEVELKDSSA